MTPVGGEPEGRLDRQNPEVKPLVIRLKWRYVPLILLALAIVEIIVFALVAQAIGAGWAVLLLLVFSGAGMAMLAREGRRGWQRVREATRGGAPVGNQAADGLAGAVGALLLFMPGFVTGVVGAILLIPPVRAFAAGRIRAATEKRVSSSTAGNLFGPRVVRAERTPTSASSSGPVGPAGSGTTTATDEVIEGEIVD
jgi:UPF0716 protein FxsA